MVNINLARPVSHSLLSNHLTLAQKYIAPTRARAGVGYRGLYETNRLIDAGLIGGAGLMVGTAVGLSLWPAFAVSAVAATLAYAISRASAPLKPGIETYTYLGATQLLINQTTDRILYRGGLPSVPRGMERYPLSGQPTFGGAFWGTIIGGGLSLLTSYFAADNWVEVKNVQEQFGPLNSFSLALLTGSLLAGRIASNRLLNYLDLRRAPTIEVEGKVAERTHETKESTDEDGTTRYTDHYRTVVSFPAGQGEEKVELTAESVYNGTRKNDTPLVYYTIGNRSGNVKTFAVDLKLRRQG